MTQHTKVLVLDVDGVVFPRSETYKREAWDYLITPFGEQGLSVFHDIEAQQGRGRGGDRYTILRATLSQLYAGSSPEGLEVLVTAFATLFDQYVQGKMRSDGVPLETRDLLHVLSQRSFPVYLNSATPEVNLRQIIETLGLTSSFKGILGRPKNKIENFEVVLQAEQCAQSELLFVGDSPSDLGAAREFDCSFLGFINPLTNDWADHPPKGVVVIASLADIPKHLG